MTFAEYLALERKGEVRHEFLDGEVFAMAGGSPEHAAIALASVPGDLPLDEIYLKVAGL